MPRFFITDGSLSPTATEAVLTGEEARHVSLSLRMAVGEELTLSDGEGNEYRARLTSLTPERCVAEVLAVAPSDTEYPFPVRLFMAYPKGDKLETVIEKAVELGATEITPFFSSRCVRRPAEDKSARLLSRYNKIAVAAAGQCGRARLPRVGETLSYGGMLAAAAAYETVLFCYEGALTRPIAEVLGPLDSPRSLAVVVGSEGGFSEEEATAAREAGMAMTGLGKRILRCETAPLVALSCIGYRYGFGKKE
ncbi:MAG: 16S rRNA (uracil(1498)-N(3))-methyltransferase [Clostridia bacterium]|nr:16S rRNA (uracil(1498)-N(3))-methyltransferase [Clostridia bacterium]